VGQQTVQIISNIQNVLN